MHKKQKKMAVFRALRQKDEPTSFTELREILGDAFAERSIRRWLNELVDEGVLVMCLWRTRLF